MNVQHTGNLQFPTGLYLSNPEHLNHLVDTGFFVGGFGVRRYLVSVAGGAWMRECVGDMGTAWDIRRDGSNGRIMIVFADSSHAMLFKLTWG